MPSGATFVVANELGDQPSLVRAGGSMAGHRASGRVDLAEVQRLRRDLSPADRVDGKSHIVVKVPAGADGSIWHTTTQTRGQVMLLNIPPLFSLHRNTVFVPREVSESEGLSTKRRDK